MKVHFRLESIVDLCLAPELGDSLPMDDEERALPNSLIK
jgi:hypothetical protein